MRGVLIGLLAIVIVTPIFSASAQAISKNQDLTRFWEQARRTPEDFAVACVPVQTPSQSVVYNLDTSFPLASVAKLLIYIEFARRVDAGQLSTAEMVHVNDLNRYDLPRTNSRAHEEFLAYFPNGTIYISLGDIAAIGMMQYSSNAASDYILSRISPVNWDELFQLLYVYNTTYPHPLSLIPLIMSNHINGELRASDVDDLSLDEGLEMYNAFINDVAWRATEIEYRYSERNVFPAWDIQSEILQRYTATGTVRDFVNVMLAVYGDGGNLSGNVKQMTRRAMQFRYDTDINATYQEYGAKLGYYSGGTLVLVAYGDPLDGDPVLSVTFFRNLPRQTYNEMRREDTIGDFAHWLNLNECSGLKERILGLS